MMVYVLTFTPSTGNTIVCEVFATASSAAKYVEEMSENQIGWRTLRNCVIRGGDLITGDIWEIIPRNLAE